MPKGFILKADALKCFSAIGYDTLLARLRRVIADTDAMELLDMIVQNYDRDTGKGLPMGNQPGRYLPCSISALSTGG